VAYRRCVPRYQTPTTTTATTTTATSATVPLNLRPRIVTARKLKAVSSPAVEKLDRLSAY
jgi:hypothetical protein